MIKVESVGLTDIGRKRNTNEDTFLIDDTLGLYIVADGMGGHNAGDVASKMVVDTLQEIFSIPRDSRQDAPAPHLSPKAEHIVACIREANAKVFYEASQADHLQGMGSTVSMIMTTDDSLIIANVGDSPVYLFRNGTEELLSVMHTFNAEQARSGNDRLFNQESFKHMLTRAIGAHSDVDVDCSEIQCLAGDILVICSDGLSNLVPAEEIRQIIENQTPEIAANELVRLANDRGGEDNITLIIIKIIDIEPFGNLFLRLLAKIINPIIHLFNR